MPTVTINQQPITVPEGTTIIQVTHSEQNAAYSDRVIKLADGWLIKE